MSEQKPKQVSVTFKKDHTHAGTDYKAGAKAQISEHWAKILKAQGVIQ